MSKKLIGMLAGASLFATGAAFAGPSIGEGHATKDEQAQTSDTQPADSQDNQGSLEADKGNDATGVGGAGEEGTSSSTDPATSGQDPAVSGTASGTTSGELGTGGAGQEAQAQQPAAEGEQQLSGKVIKAQGNKLFVEHMGAIVELRTDSKTQFEGDVKRTKDLKEGDEIRASFTVKNQTQNKAVSISKSTGTGGSGVEDLGSSDPGTLDNTPPPASEGDLGGGQGGAGSEGTGSESGSMDGTGGAGLEGSTPDTMGTEPSQDLPTQTGSESGVSSPPVDEGSSESGTQIQ